MTRIIAGFAGSLVLTVPDAGTRPTSDRVREAIFSALDARDALTGAHVLDLYAGSGALGLEAASRGAASVTLVERSIAAAQACRNNAARVQKNAPKTSPLEIVVSSQPVQAFLSSNLATWGRATWDLVFLDPPYELSESELLHNLQSLTPLLSPDATVVLERSSRSAEPSWPHGLALDRRKVYGDTALWWLRAQHDG